MKGWTDIGSDVNWSEYGGKWAKRSKDGSWYIVEFTNMYDACGENDCKRDGQAQYVAEAKRVDLTELNSEQLDDALRCVGFRFEDDAIVSDSGDEVAPAGILGAVAREMVLVEACASYGFVQPLEGFSGDSYPERIRAKARRACEALMRDAVALETALEKPVNGIGSTAREYGRGDLNAALGRGPFDTSKNLMRKMHGLPPENEVSFGTLHPDGTVTDERKIRQSDMLACPFAIMMPDHYRSDGSCKCDDASHRETMIREWGYEASSFEGIPLRG